MKYLALFFILFYSCGQKPDSNSLNEGDSDERAGLTKISLVILGTVQDGGSPHIGCKKDCCKELFIHPDESRKVVSMGLIDPINNKKYIIEATPDFTQQLSLLSTYATFESDKIIDGIFLTHAHIGHYTGLMYLGKEALGAKNIPVYAMSRMQYFLNNNGPWSALVSNQNISIQKLENKQAEVLTSKLQVIPFTVPHRDEYSETVGYTIIGPNKKVLFIPDINKWEIWEKDIVDEISKVDYAFIDATFFDGEEINHRDISEIPHPFVIESMKMFNLLPAKEKDKIYFIHFNHTNPLLNPSSEQTKKVLNSGYHIAKINEVFDL